MRPRLLLIGDGAGIGPVIAAADRLRSCDHPPLVLLGSDDPFPFRPRPSAILVPGLPPHCIACMPLLEEWGIASRLASSAGLPGCFEGTVTELAAVWLTALGPEELRAVDIRVSGSPSTLAAAADLARRFAASFSQLSAGNS